MLSLVPQNVEAPQFPPIDVCIRAFIRAKGKLERAAEELAIPIEELALILAREKVATYEAMEAITLMSAFDVFTYMSKFIKPAIATAADSHPEHVIRGYTGMLSTIKEFTSPRGASLLGGAGGTFIGSVNVDQRILEALDPREREALLILASGQGQSQAQAQEPAYTIEHQQPYEPVADNSAIVDSTDPSIGSGQESPASAQLTATNLEPAVVNHSTENNNIHPSNLEFVPTRAGE